ncbi:MAG: DUF1592 domain-containing protein [Pirellulaceae bacterium]
MIGKVRAVASALLAAASFFAHGGHGYAQTEASRVEPVRVSSEVIGFLHKHCAKCHGPDEQNGSMRFDTTPPTISDDTIALQWQDILDIVNLDRMPPEDAQQPPTEELSNFLESLTHDLSRARQALTDSGGHVVLRRMNRREYQQTIKALFGVPVEVHLLPDDGKVNGFDTLGEAQGFSSLQLERYLDLGRKVLDRVIVTDRRPGSAELVQSHSEVEGANRKIEDEIPKLQRKLESNRLRNANDELRRDINQRELEFAREYLARAETRTGVVIPFHGVNPSTFVQMGNNTPHGRYRLRVRCGAVSETPVDDLHLRVVRGDFRSEVPDAVDYFQVRGTVAQPQTIEFVVELDDQIRSNRFTFERRHKRWEKVERLAEARSYFFRFKELAYLLDDAQTNLWIDWIETEGPLPPSSPPPLGRQALFGERDPDEMDDADAREIIERFAYEAFRRQRPEREHIDSLWSIYKASRNHGADFETALKDALVVVLASPRFLFLFEPTGEGAMRRPLTGRELAVRLSYFLWSAPPDEALYRAVEEGALRDRDVLARQVDRMIEDPRAAAFVEAFVSQWLELDRLDLIDPAATSSVRHDNAENRYDEAVQQASKREVFAFFRTLLIEDRSVADLADSDFAVVNSLMAQFYGLPGVAGDEFRKVELPPESVRGGLLGQSAILTLTGTGDRTSPVERGAYVLRKLLNRPPPPAPANVPMLNEDEVGSRSIRETLAIHMNTPQCMSCHRRIDPIGFGMENLDPLGRWRDEVPSSDESAAFSIDPRGVMPDGKREFAGFRELKQLVRDDRDALLTAWTEALMTYGLGRTIGFTDREVVDRIAAETTEADYGLRTLVHRIVQSEAFLSK